MADPKVVFTLIGKDLASKAFKDAGKNADELGKKTDGLNKLGSAAGKAAAGGVLALGAAFVSGIKDAAAYEVLGKKTEAVIKSTGNVANISVSGVQKMAASLENMSGVDEELIINSQNVLATFTKVRNEVGAGNDVFNQGAEAALNMSVALGQDLQSATMTIGKALNDPIKGVTALRRAGVQLTEQQTAQIKTMVESGDVMGAQKVILKELETQFGGAAKAAGNTFQGQLARAQDALSDMAREAGSVVLPVLGDIAEWVAQDGVPALKDFGGAIGSVVGGAFDTFNELPGAVQGGVVALGALAVAGRKVNDVGSKVNASVTEPFRRLRYEMDFQRLVAEDTGKQIGTMGAAMAVTRGKVGGLTGAVSKLKSAGAGLLGILGGPWGLAILGGSIALGAFASASAEAEARQEELREAGKGVAEAIVEQNNVINESVVQAAAKAAENKGLLKGLHDLGFEYGTVTDAILGQGDALNTIRAALEVQRQKYAELAGGAVGEARNQYMGQAEAVIRLRDDLNALVGGKDSELAATKRVNAATKEGTKQRGKEKDAADEQYASIKELIAAKQEEAGVVLSGREAQRQYQEAVDAARESAKENGKTLDINSRKGRTNQAALDAIADAAYRQAEALRANHAPTSLLQSKMKTARSEFARAARQMGMSEEEARKLARRLLTIEGKYEAKIYADTGPAKRQLDSFVKKYSGKSIQLQADIAKWAKQNASSLPQFATGGRIPGAPSSRDNTIAAVATGEYIVNARSTSKHMSLLEAINSDRLPAFATGGPVTLKAKASTAAASAELNRAIKQAVQGMMGIFGGGGKALAWARSQAGKPYIWGGVGPSGYDCSGFMSAITNVIRGRNPYSRLGSTGTFPWGGFAPGPGRFMIGSQAAGGIGGSIVGHMAGTLGGVNVESRGGDGVVVGGSARGARSGLFGGNVWHLKGYANGGIVGDAPFDLIDPKGKYARLRLASFDQGGYLMPGYTLAHNGTGKPEAVGPVGNTYIVNVYTNGVLGQTTQDVQNNLVKTLVSLDKQGRLPKAKS